MPPRPSVGALFAGANAQQHHCSASVVRSPGGNIVLAAAHCVSGNGAGLTFAPGYRNGSSPFGRWSITAAYVDPTWRSGQNPLRDYVFLVVAPRLVNGRWRNVQELVGGARLGTSPASGTSVQVDGYVAGSNDQQIGCTARTYVTSGYPAFDCGGFPGGTSGSPFLLSPPPSATDGVVVGTIGGLHQGGCSPSTSYSSPFDAATSAVFARAAAGGPADVLPQAGGDGC